MTEDFQIPRIGGTASPSQNELVSAARVVLDTWGIAVSQNKIVRLVRRFKDRAPQADRQLFFKFLASSLQVPRSRLEEPETLRLITYMDPTGETAVNNVLRGHAA